MRRSAPFICAAALFASGCSGGDAPVSDQERRTGAELHPQLLAEFGGAYEGDEAAYVANLGGKLAATADLADQCTFTLVNSDVVNAFAVPGCYIYVTRGLMSIVNSEAELVSVLAHELGHIAANHSERQQRRSLFRALGVAAVSLLSGSERLSQIAGAAAGYFTLRYSRKHEYEADDLGLTYLTEAGYDPFASVDMLGALGRHQQFLSTTRGRDAARGIPEWALTHPLSENRVARSLAAAERTGQKRGALPEHERAYLESVDGLLYGDDPQQGFVIGRRFAHPVMRIAFEAPPGFTLTNSPAAISIEGPDGLAGEFAGGRLPPGGLMAYAEAVIASLLRNAPVEIGAPERTVVNGLPTVLVPASVATQRGTVGLMLAAYDAGSGDAYHFVMVANPGVAPAEALSALFGSFRLLSTAEAASLRPLRIDTVRVGPGATVASLAARMATDHKLQHFLMLNGRTAESPPRPGDTVKIVVPAPR